MSLMPINSSGGTARGICQGQGGGKTFPYGLHNPDFFVDLAAIPVGARVNTATALSVLAKSAGPAQ